MNKQHDYYQARAASQREIADQLHGTARQQHLTLAAMYEALATEAKPQGAAVSSKARDIPEAPETERAYFERRAREERARAADSDDATVRRIRFEMADEYLRRAGASES